MDVLHFFLVTARKKQIRAIKEKLYILFNLLMVRAAGGRHGNLKWITVNNKGIGFAGASIQIVKFYIANAFGSTCKLCVFTCVDVMVSTALSAAVDIFRAVRRLLLPSRCGPYHLSVCSTIMSFAARKTPERKTETCRECVRRHSE